MIMMWTTECIFGSNNDDGKETRKKSDRHGTGLDIVANCEEYDIEHRVLESS